MTPILETTAVALVYILVLQPFYLLEILPFWGFLEEEKKKPFCRAWVAMTVAETGLTVGLVQSGLFSSEPAAYWAIGYIVWLPPVPPQLPGYPEVLGGAPVHPVLPSSAIQLFLYLPSTFFSVFLAGK